MLCALSRGDRGATVRRRHVRRVHKPVCVRAGADPNNACAHVLGVKSSWNTSLWSIRSFACARYKFEQSEIVFECAQKGHANFNAPNIKRDFCDFHRNSRFKIKPLCEFHRRKQTCWPFLRILYKLMCKGGPGRKSRSRAGSIETIYRTDLISRPTHSSHQGRAQATVIEKLPDALILSLPRCT